MSLGTLCGDGPLCPFNHRVLIAARELDLPIDVRYGDEVPAAIRDANTSGSWPVFLPADGGPLLRDSDEIVEFLIAHGGEKGTAYRSDPGTLATLDTLVTCISKVIRAGEPAMQREFRQKLDEALRETETLRAASDGPYLGGRHFSQADGHVAPFLYRLPFLVEVRDHVPAIFRENDAFNAWVDRVVNRPSFRAIAPRRCRLRNFYADKASYGKPMKIGRLHHSGFRGMWNDLLARTTALTAGDDGDNAALQEARDLCFLLFRAVALHAKFENLVLFPALDAEKGDPGFTTEGIDQHDHEVHQMNDLLDRYDHALRQPPGGRDATMRDLADACARLREGQFAHLDYEEANYLPVLGGMDLEQHVAMLRGAYQMCILERPHLIGVLAAYMPVENVLSLLDSLLVAVEPDSGEWRKLLAAMHAHLDAATWLRVARRFEDVLPTSLLVLPGRSGGASIGEAARALQQAAPVDRIEIPKA